MSLSKAPSLRRKLKTSASLQKELRAHRRAHRKIVFTNGCFDLLHVGHIRYLAQAKSLGDILVVGLNSDFSVKKIKGPKRPVTPEKERAEVLSSLESVDYIVLFAEATPLKLIRSVKPDYLTKGGDWKVHEIVGGEWVEAQGGRVVSLGFSPGRSTTEILKKLKNL